MSRITFHGGVDGHTGYGHIIEMLGLHFEAMGTEVRYWPYSVSDKFIPIPNFVRERIVETTEESRVLYAHVPIGPVPPDRVITWLTMWESSSLPAESVERLNRALSLIVPCKWNKEVFRKSGVTRPIDVVPMGLDPCFSFVPKQPTDTCLFGTAGRMKHGLLRKGIQDTIDCFRKAFSNEKDVRLDVKIWPDDPYVDAKDDERINIVRQPWPKQQLIDWYRNLTCYVTASRAEGWGLQPFQALGCGTPVIGSFFSGHAEFLDDEIAYRVNHRMVLPLGTDYRGVWGEPNRDEIIERMRQVYKDRDEAARKGKLGAKKMSAFTWANTAQAILEAFYRHERP